MSSPFDPSKLFTNDWIITILSHPHLTFHRSSPTHFPTILALEANPLNSPFSAPSVRNLPHTPQTDADDFQIMLSSYLSSPETHLALHLIVQQDGETIGLGGATGRGDWANIGRIFVESARGKGVGEVMMRLLLRLSGEVRVQSVGAGTMRENRAMRGLMRKLGLEETEEV